MMCALTLAFRKQTQLNEHKNYIVGATYYKSSIYMDKT